MDQAGIQLTSPIQDNQQLQHEINRVPMMNQEDEQLPSIDEENPLSQQQQQYNTPGASSSTPAPPKLPNLKLIGDESGSREDYLKIGIPLYEASINCDWKTANALFIKDPQLVRCSITGNGETALHVAASAKGSKHAEEFVKNLVDLMTNNDLELQNNSCNTALHLAAAAGNIKAVKIMVERNKDLLTIPGSSEMMPLYTAALCGYEDVVKYLYNKSNRLGDVGWTPKNRGWLLQKCVENDMFDVALEIVKTHPELRTGTVLEILARKPEAFPEPKINIVSKAIHQAKRINSRMLSSRQPSQNEPSEVASASGPTEPSQRPEPLPITRQQSQNEHPEEAGSGSGPTEPSQSPEPFPETKSNIIKRTIKSVCEFFGLKGRSHEKEDYALKLLRIIWEDIAKKPRKEIDDILRGQADKKQDKKLACETQNVPPANTKKTYSSRILFIAAEMGNTVFLIELIRLYPDLIWKVDDNKQSIFHIAVKHRHEGIYNLLYEIGSMKDLITPLRDGEDNNMLHLVGQRAKQKRLEDVSGVALQMQRELLWFKEVKAMIPTSYRERKNKEGLTPYELFTKEHKELVTHGEKWMKDTASQCMVVATLIATIVFAAAFTVPGGYNQNNDQQNGDRQNGDQQNGYPVFHSKTIFKVFVLADAVSLFASSAAILMFLSILTSRYAERDFLDSLPKKLMLGLATLFLSVTTMTITFSVSFFVLYHKGLLWMPIIISIFAVSPVLLYMVLQFGLFFDVIRSTYRSRYLFKPQKNVLYYKNPSV